MKNEPMEVKDGSQPYKLIMGFVALLAAFSFVTFTLVPWMDEVLMVLKSIEAK